MKRCLFPRLFALLVVALAALSPAAAQIPAPVTTGEPIYKADGKTDQPFTVEVLGARRSVNNVLLLRLALTNRGTAPLQPHQDFSGNSNPTDNDRISAVFAVDPNGRKKYAVIRDAHNQPLCSQITPALQPGERRVVEAQLPAPPDTTSAVDVYFPKATAILGVPIGLPQAGEPLPGGAGIVTPTGPTVPAGAAPVAPTSAINEPTSNNLPNVYTNQTNAAAPGKGIGSIQSANSDTPFTVEVTSLKANGGGGHALLRLAMTNNGSGSLDPADQFTTGIGDPADARTISGLYLVDPATKQRFNVVRESQTRALCSKIDPILSPGERRMLEAQFPAIPPTVKTVYVYFPHATPIADVPVTP